jgi:hypothetical protein
MSNHVLYISSSANTLLNRSKHSDILHPILFPVSTSGNFYYTNLPDAILYFTSSQNATSTSTVASTINTRSVKNFQNPQIYSPFYLLGTRTTLATAGPTIRYESLGHFSAGNITIASTLTALTRGNFGTVTKVGAVAAGLAAANTTYPSTMQGVVYGSTLDNNRNICNHSIALASEDNVNTVTITSSSLYLDRFIGYSSSVAPITASYNPITVSGSNLINIPTNSTITGSIIFNTSSIWISQSLATNVVNTSNTVYATVFTLTGLTNGKTYLVNFYLIARSAATGTGFRMRVLNGSNYRGSLFTPTSNTAYAIQNSADGNNITSVTATTWPTANSDRLVYGEYSVTKAAGTDPQIQILSETNGTAVTAGSGSVVFYRVME